MGRSGLLKTIVPRLEKYMKSRQEPLTAGEVAKTFDVSHSSAYNVLLYMESIEIIQHVKRGRRKLYFLKDSSEVETLTSNIPRSRELGLPEGSEHATGSDRSMPEPSGDEEPRPANYPKSKDDMLPALAILGISNNDPSEPRTQKDDEQPDDPGEKRAETPLFIKVRRYGRVKAIPKEVRHLSRSDTIYLKEKHLKGLDGYEDIEHFKCFFSEMQALKRGEYGSVYYASMGTNPWEKSYKITVEQAEG